MAFDLDDEELKATKKLYLKNKIISDLTQQDIKSEEEVK